MPREPRVPPRRVRPNAFALHTSHALLVLVVAFTNAGFAQELPTRRTVAPAHVPDEARGPGELLDAVTFRDRRGRNVVTLSMVQPNATTAVVHLRHVFGHRRTLRVERQTSFRCPDSLDVTVASLTSSDVDGDGVAEIVVVLRSRCGDGREREVPMAFEDGTDLIAAEQTTCGGDAEMPASLRHRRLARGIRRRWRKLLWDRARFVSPSSRTGRRARSSRVGPPVPGAAVAVDTLRWRDRSGVYAVVVEETRGEEGGVEHWSLTVTRYRLVSGGWQRIGALPASARCESGDSTAGYHRPSVHLSDWNADGVRELSYLRTAGCMTDYSPSTATLVVLEGDRVDEVRGSTWVGNPEDPNDCAFDPTLRFADDPIHALVRRLAIDT